MYHPDAAEWQDWYAYCPDQPSLEQHESFELFEVPAWSLSLVAESDPEAPATYMCYVSMMEMPTYVVFIANIVLLNIEMKLVFNLSST